MPEQILQIEPPYELKFKGPFTVPTTSMLKLTNPSDKRVCFKIKTTAPKRYCVRPNSGLLEPFQSLTIAVVFQPCELEPAANKHKFMVQSIFAADGDINMDQLWKDPDTSKVMDTKLRCSFELPDDANDQNKFNAVQEEMVTRGTRHEDSAAPKKEDSIVKTSENKVNIDISHVQKQNRELREEVDKLSRMLKSQANSGGMSIGNPSPPAVPMLYIVLAIAAILVGLILGKFIL